MNMSEGRAEGLESLIEQMLYRCGDLESDRRALQCSFADFDCRYCSEKEECQGECLCPHIMGNLPDLFHDPEFVLAVKNAESCKTPHKETLLYLQNQEPDGKSDGESDNGTCIRTLADLDCRFCFETEECQGECLCPYIFRNLPSLILDPKFLKAVKNAESCKTPHKETLLYLRDQEATGSVLAGRKATK